MPQCRAKFSISTIFIRRGVNTSILAQMTDATLFTMNPETQAIEPGVALSYDFVDDATIDVQLRDDVRFS